MNLADLRESDLKLANLSGADLRGVDLSGADLEGTKYNDKTTLPFDDAEAKEKGMVKGK